MSGGLRFIKLGEARAHLGKYTQKAVNVEIFIIANRNRPPARLMPIEDQELGTCPKIGLLRNQCKIAEDFYAPLQDFEASYYGECKLTPERQGGAVVGKSNYSLGDPSKIRYWQNLPASSA